MERATPAVLFAFALAYIAISAMTYADEGVRPAPMSDEAREGKRAWERRNCSACHQIYGMGGYLGPDLTNVWSRRGSNHVARVLTEGWQDMPNLNLAEREIERLMDYLEFLDTTGTFPPRTWPPPGLPR